MQFPAAASLLVYAGYNAATDNETIVSEPRTFSTPAVSNSLSLTFPAVSQMKLLHKL